MVFRICIAIVIATFSVGSVFGQINCPPNLPLTLVGNTTYCIGTSGSELNIDESYDEYEWLPTSETGQNVLLTAGDYQVVVTHYTGCTDTLEFEVEQVSNPPQPTIAANGPTQFCAGGSVVLSGPSGYPYYEWNSGSISNEITVFESGTFVISVVDWIGCTSSSNSIQVVVDPLPVAAFSPNLNLFDIEFNNLSVDAIDYEWNFGDGNTSLDFEPNYTYTSEGLHEMYLVASNNCGSDTAFLDLASVGIAEEAISAITLYPNPSSGLITIGLSSKIDQTISISVVDLTGKIIDERQENVRPGIHKITLDHHSLLSGMYILNLLSKTGLHSTRLIIQ